jgi:hypothetical protein
MSSSVAAHGQSPARRGEMVRRRIRLKMAGNWFEVAMAGDASVASRGCAEMADPLEIDEQQLAPVEIL